MKRFYFLRVLLCLLVLSAISCGGSSGSDNVSASVGDNNILNPLLSGKLLFEYNDSAYLKDLKTGVNTKIPNTDWPKQGNIFPDAFASFSLNAPPHNSDEFIVKVNSCKQAGADILSPYLACVALQDYNGNYSNYFDIAEDISSSVKLSRDHQYVAFFRDLDDDWLAIYARDGTFVSNRKVGLSSFDWLSDGSIVYSESRRFVFTDRYSTLPTDYLTLPDTIDGSLSNISVSPDGLRIAFSMYQNGNLAAVYAIPYVMNIDGKNIRQLARRPEGTSQIIGAPKWSPDGLSIFLTAGGASGQDLGSPGVLGYGYVIPSNASEIMILSSDDREKSSDVIRLKHYLLGQAGNIVTERFNNYSYSWQP